MKWLDKMCVCVIQSIQSEFYFLFFFYTSTHAQKQTIRSHIYVVVERLYRPVGWIIKSFFTASLEADWRFIQIRPDQMSLFQLMRPQEASLFRLGCDSDYKRNIRVPLNTASDFILEGNREKTPEKWNIRRQNRQERDIISSCLIILTTSFRDEKKKPVKFMHLRPHTTEKTMAGPPPGKKSPSYPRATAGGHTQDLW